MPESVTLPVAVAVDPSALPPRCTRHGEPEVLRRPVRFVSRTSPAGDAAQLVVALAGVIRTPRRWELRCPAWPFCHRCHGAYARRLPIGWGIGIAVPALVVLLAVLTGGAVPPFGVLLGVLGGIAAGSVVAGGASWSGLAGGEVTKDGAAVVVARAAPEFVAALRR